MLSRWWGGGEGDRAKAGDLTQQVCPWLELLIICRVLGVGTFEVKFWFVHLHQTHENRRKVLWKLQRQEEKTLRIRQIEDKDQERKMENQQEKTKEDL